MAVWPGKAAVDLIGFKIEFKVPHSTHKNQQNPSEFFFIEYKKKIENYICD